jgi:hypothetical protein
MPNAAKVLMLALGLAALGACHGKQPQANASANEDLSLDDNVSNTQVPANAEIETLPADESSTTSSGELTKGQDNPDVNDVGNHD